MSDNKMLDFCDALEQAVREKDSTMSVRLGRAAHGEYLVTIENAIHKESYTVNLTKGSWMVIYGT